jgi:hypothetical protein
MLGDYPWLAFAIPIYPKGVEVEVRALCMPAKFFHTDLNKSFLYGPHGSIVMLKQQTVFPKLLLQS